MKIGIDTFGCNHGQSGFGSYITNVVSNLPADLIQINKDAVTINADTAPSSETTQERKLKAQVELFGIEEDRYVYTSGKALNYVSTPMIANLKAERMWHKHKITKFIKKNEYDAVVYPAACRVLPSKFKNHTGVAIINSILSADFENESASFKRHILKSLKNIQIIIASTIFIKDDLISLGIDAKKIKVIHSGIDHKLFYQRMELDSEIVDVKPFAIKRPYFIYGTNLSSPDKKHIELIHAFERFKKNTGLPHRLVIAGNDGPYAEQIHKVVFDSEYASDIFLIGFFPHESFAKLYAGAEACLFPSVNEGVGLPILEAMACGIPVLCSEKGALKEIGGTAPLYINSDSIDDIATKMQKIVEDQELRDNIVTDGVVWANEFNWEKTVRETINFIINSQA